MKEKIWLHENLYFVRELVEHRVLEAIRRVYCIFDISDNLTSLDSFHCEPSNNKQLNHKHNHLHYNYYSI